MSSKQHPFYRSRAFTLLELIIAVVILAILAVIAIPNYLNVVHNAETASQSNSLNALSVDAVSIARSGNRTVPIWTDVVSASHETKPVPLTNGSPWTIVSSTEAIPAPSIWPGLVSVDFTDSPQYLGIAMLSSSNQCIMVRADASETQVWVYTQFLGTACDGSAALGGPKQPAPTPAFKYSYIPGWTTNDTVVGSSLTTTWAGAPTSVNGQPVTSYAVWMQADGVWSQVGTVPVTSTSFTIPDVPDTWYIPGLQPITAGGPATIIAGNSESCMSSPADPGCAAVQPW